MFSSAMEELERLQLVSKVCCELENHFGVDNKVLFVWKHMPSTSECHTFREGGRQHRVGVSFICSRPVLIQILSLISKLII